MPDSTPILLSYSTGEPREPLGRLWLFVVLSIPGLIAPFVAFTYDVSPWRAVTEGTNELWSRRQGPDIWIFIVMGAGFFMVFPQLYWRLRLVLSAGPLSTVEKWMAFIAGTLNCTALIAFVIHVTPQITPSGRMNEWLATWSIPAILAPGILFLLTPYGRALPIAGRLMIAMLLPYIANSTLCLLGFMDDRSVGYYLTLAAVVIAIVEMVILCLRRNAPL